MVEVKVYCAALRLSRGLPFLVGVWPETVPLLERSPEPTLEKLSRVDVGVVITLTVTHDGVTLVMLMLVFAVGSDAVGNDAVGNSR